MTSIIKHEAPPIPTPPTTYDILGLTEEQAHMIMSLIGPTITFKERK